MNAPTGTVFINVGFASYGTPGGSCPNYTIGTCHATTSQSVAEGYLLGNNAASIPAANAVFGDPCYGTAKRLYVLATYTEPINSGTAPGTITGALPTGGDGAYTYLWESSTTSSSSGFAAASGTNNGQNYIPGVLTQDTWFRRTVLSGCSKDISKVILIKVNTATGVNTINSAQVVCSGSAPAPLSGSIPSGTPSSYLWESSTTSNVAGFGPASGTNNGQNYTPGVLAVDTWYRRTVKYSSGPDDISAAIKMTISAYLPVSVLIAASDITVCGNTPVTFTATPTNGGTAPSYQWFVGPTPVVGVNSATYTYNPINGDVVTCVLTSNVPCVSGANPVTSNSVTMAVSAAIGNNTVSYAVGSGVVCATAGENGTAVLTAPPKNVFTSVDLRVMEIRWVAAMPLPLDPVMQLPANQ